MKCPACGSALPDGAVACPRCGEPVGVTQKLSLSSATWCPSCGALVPPGADTCPKCNTSLSGDAPEEAPAPARRTRDLDLPSIGNTGVIDVEEETGVMTRIESAIPRADDENTPSARGDRMPRTRSFALAALLGIVVVGGATLLITHPWDPDATRISAVVPADTSMQGFPGTVDSLSGQDSSGEQTSALQQVADTLSSAYERLGELSDEVDESERDVRSTGVTGTSEERAAGLERARSVSIDLSNLIDDISALVSDTSEWGEDASRLSTLGNWLRNRCDAVVAAWEASAESDDPAADEQDILSELSQSASFKSLFDERYDEWAPSVSVE